jgi:hypothetical protein
LDDVSLVKAVRGFHMKRKASRSYTGKAKALFIAAYNLGGLENGTDAALDAFVKRQTGKERLAFLTAAEANSVSEALKAICERHGFVPLKDGHEARIALVEAQWARLAALGQLHIPGPDALANYISKKYLSCHGSGRNLTDAQLDDCAKAFGRWIRKAQHGND